MLKKDIEVINEMFIEERECGHTCFDFDDYEHDQLEMAETIGVKLVYDEEEDEYKIANEKDKQRVNECLDYYYSLKG